MRTSSACVVAAALLACGGQESGPERAPSTPPSSAKAQTAEAKAPSDAQLAAARAQRAAELAAELALPESVAGALLQAAAGLDPEAPATHERMADLALLYRELESELGSSGTGHAGDTHPRVLAALQAADFEVFAELRRRKDVF